MALRKNLLMIVICIILGNLASLATSRAVYKASIAQKFDQWMAEYGRVYQNSTEKERRFAIFKKNVEFVEKFNSDGKKSYTLSINQFSDLTDEEFLKHHTGYKTLINSNSTTSSEDESLMYQSQSTDEIPARMDWREHGAVTPIKNQHSCDACWIFAAVAAVEGITKIKTGKLVSLSEQQVLECSDNYLSRMTRIHQNCRRGDIVSAFRYILKNKGIATEKEYPYLNTTSSYGTCDARKETKHAAKITGYQKVPFGANSLLNAVSRQPVSVAIYSGPEFKSYSGGMFEESCNIKRNHAVTIIGYGTENDTDYWLIKNSYGETWGEKGYMRIRRDQIGRGIGLCDLGSYAFYPVV